MSFYLGKIELEGICLVPLKPSSSMNSPPTCKIQQMMLQIISARLTETKTKYKQNGKIKRQKIWIKITRKMKEKDFNNSKNKPKITEIRINKRRDAIPVLVLHTLPLTTLYW